MKSFSESAVEDVSLGKTAREIAFAVRDLATIDWNLKDGIHAMMRSDTRRLLSKPMYPCDADDKAVTHVPD